MDVAALLDEQRACYRARAAAEMLVRKLNDGRQFRIVKRFYAPDVLRRHLQELGWQIDARQTGEFSTYGGGAPMR